MKYIIYHAGMGILNKSEFTAQDISEISRLKPSQIGFYCNQIPIVAEIDAGVGRGKTKRFSRHNLNQFLIIKALVDLGMAISKIRIIIKHLEAHHYFREYEKQPSEAEMYIKVFPRDDGKIAAGWMINSDGSDHYPILKASEMTNFNECIVINVKRILWK